MYAYRTPGVYFEWLDTAPGIRVLRTDITGFVGIAERGVLHTPVRIESWQQFLATFGGHIPQAYLAYAVEGFFANGGATCWIVRVADPAEAKAAWIDLPEGEDQSVLRIIASSPGTWGQQLFWSVVKSGKQRFNLSLRMKDGSVEQWCDLSLNPGDRRAADRLINDKSTGSKLINIEIPDNGDLSDFSECNGFLNRSGKDGLSTLTPKHFIGNESSNNDHWGLSALELIDEVGIVSIPDIMRKIRLETNFVERTVNCEDLSGNSENFAYPEVEPEYPPNFDNEQIFYLQQSLIAHCGRLKDRVAILDPATDELTPDKILSTQLTQGDRQGTYYRYASLYYPWIKVVDPLGLPGSVRDIPPSGHIAGLYALSDKRIGVHKPPANEALEAVKDLAEVVDDIDHGRLNEHGINVIRAYPGRGIRVAGARTLSTDPDWRYVNVRRLMIMIEEAIDEQTQWTVFEPNNQALWHDLERTIRNFLLLLWQRGMLDGATAEDAFFARCDETTNRPEEVQNGRLICLVGVQPPWPAEFVVVRIGKTEGGTEFLENSGVENG